MTKPINIADLLSVSTLEGSVFVSYERMLSRRKNCLQYRKEEIDALSKLAEACNIDSPKSELLLDGFAYSYTIPQISKEFDLLKISHDHSVALNIEVKSQITDLAKAQKQLRQNRYYLSPIADAPLCYCFCGSAGQVYTLDSHHELCETSLAQLLASLRSISRWEREDFDSFFRPVDYLVSPFNNPNAFLEGRYFLTNGQERIREKCLKDIPLTSTVSVIKGKAGTGKSLLAYDIARKLGERDKTCIVHCGVLCDGHKMLNRIQSSFEVIPAKELQSICSGEDPLASYRFVIVDEAQRMYAHQLEYILKKTSGGSISCIVCMDGEQTLSASEKGRNIICAISESGCTPSPHELTNRIRTNPELAAFVRAVFDLKTISPDQPFGNAQLIYAKDAIAAHRRLTLLEAEGFKPIPLTSSRFYSDRHGLKLLDSVQWDNSHIVVGQEFDRVAVAAGPNFYYDNSGVLRSSRHPNPAYITEKLLFQAMTRARRNIALIIYGNEPLFRQLVSALGSSGKSSW
jgi:Uncharacterized conserved protein (DUF2075).